LKRFKFRKRLMLIFFLVFYLANSTVLPVLATDLENIDNKYYSNKIEKENSGSLSDATTTSVISESIEETFTEEIGNQNQDKFVIDKEDNQNTADTIINNGVFPIKQTVHS
jgi:hypothetical protein